jgi:hypothetical protein
VIVWLKPGVVVALAVVAMAATAREDSAAERDSLDLSRIAAVRVFQGNQFPPRGETPQSIARTLAKLRPTFVMAPLRYGLPDRVEGREERAWELIREKVRKVVPHAKFAVALNAIQYHSRRAVRHKMDDLRSHVQPDAWIFDLYTKATRKRAHVMRAAVADAHSNGEAIGGVIFGLTKAPLVPRGTDFVVVQGGNFHFDLTAVRRLAARFPVIAQINNSPKYARSDGCRFIREFSAAKRRAYVRRRAEQQHRYRFRFAYPVFFPECNAHLGTPRQQLFTYNATEDPGMMKLIRRLMNRHD